LKKFQGILTEKGLEPIEAIGQEFNPEMHEALLQKESDTQPPNTVLEEHLKGYKFKDQVIRHSKVIVNK
jgi:molecular chaperone GrpE